MFRPFGRCDFGYLFRMAVIFPLFDCLKSYAWDKIETETLSTSDTVYLNPMLLDRYRKRKSIRERTTLLCIMYCIVCHELTHLLHFRIYNTVDPIFRPQNGSEIPKDLGNEVERRIFGGRILTTADFSALRIERGNGDVYELDPTYFYEQFVLSNRCVIEFEKLKRVEPDRDPHELRWMGMGEINGTHDACILGLSRGKTTSLLMCLMISGTRFIGNNL